MVQLTQPKGMVSKETNKEAIARVFGLKKRQVGYLSTSTVVDSYTILYDEDTQTCWYRGSATGTPTSWTIAGSSLSLSTTIGSFTLVPAYSGDFLKSQIASSSGSSMVGLRQGGTLDSTLVWVTPEMYSAVGDGITDDTTALRNCFADTTNKGLAIVFPANKSYLVSGALDASEVRAIVGNGSTLVYKSSPTASTTLIKMGKQKGALTGLNIAVSQYATTITIPGISTYATIGDLLSLQSSTIRVGASESNYLYGQRCVVKSITGDVVTLMAPILEAFTVTGCTIHRKGNLSVENLNIDLTNLPSTTYLVEGISITGVGISVRNCNIRSNQYGSAGLVIQGCNSQIVGNIVSGFLNANGVSSGGRTGYGIYLDCNNTLVQGNHLEGNKHQLTCASRSYVMSGLLVTRNYATSLGQTTSDAVFDLHANVLGKPVFCNNEIFAQRSAFGIRNGSAEIRENYIYSNRPTDTTPALIGLDEYPTIRSLVVADNTLVCDSNIRLLSFAELTSITNLQIKGNVGTIGSLIDQAMNVSSMITVDILDNRLSGMAKIINMNRRSAASTQTMFSLIQDLKIEGNIFDCTVDDLVTYVFNIYSHANTALADRLEVRNLTVKDNKINSTDTPILLDYLRLTGKTEFTANLLTHTVSGNTTTPPTQTSIGFYNSPIESLIVRSNTMSGRLRWTVREIQPLTSVTYAVESPKITFNVEDNTSLGATFENLWTSASIVFGDSQYKNSHPIGVYGTTLAFLNATSSPGWGASGIVDISENFFQPLSGASVAIGVGFGTHKFIIRNNLMTSAITDASTASVPPSNNITVT
ncbi:tail spike protein [Klebsiella phage phi1_175008]|uniref:Tail spike protein n=2 Tax=Klebsiella phage phi1_175008 TaxID=3127744 RepID=A0ACD5FRZ1_9CAUD